MRKYLQRIVLLLGIVAVVSNPYLQSGERVVSSAVKDQKPYSTNMKELRTRFNKDKGKVRLLMLLSPT